jgi:protein-tyrosine phosphatase
MIAYLMKFKKLSYEKGLQMLKTKRPDVMPNVGFIQQLL